VDFPDTPIWRNLRELASLDGMTLIDLTDVLVGGPEQYPYRILVVRDSSGEVEMLRCKHSGNDDDLAREIAWQLGLPL
jgi:hypothetical protein